MPNFISNSFVFFPLFFTFLKDLMNGTVYVSIYGWLFGVRNRETIETGVTVFLL